jgi:hypothetical protein
VLSEVLQSKVKSVVDCCGAARELKVKLLEQAAAARDANKRTAIPTSCELWIVPRRMSYIRITAQ